MTTVTQTVEIQRWRQMNNNQQAGDTRAVSPQYRLQHQQSAGGMLSRRADSATLPPDNMSAEESGNSEESYRKFYVTLAKESPKRISNDEESSEYDSAHNRETDFCRNSTDDDCEASVILEYEVNSDSATENLYSDDSSSGTDDIFLAAVAVSAICPSTSFSSDFADTEEDSSDDSSKTYDSELSSADYWVCVKCKNRQNNPMFRYCEKCYQIRKTHFPPRPRLRKSRSANKAKFSPYRRSASAVRASTTGFLDTRNIADQSTNSELLKRFIDSTSPSYSRNRYMKSKLCSTERSGSDYNKHRLSYMNSSQLNSAAETSSDDSDSGQNSFYSSSNNRKFSANKSIEQISTKGPHESSKRKRKSSSVATTAAADDAIPAKKSCNNNNKILPAGDNIFSDSETDVVVDHLASNSQKDSGFSSAPSSQDMCPTEIDSISSSTKPLKTAKDPAISYLAKEDDEDSSDTVCEELDDKDLVELSASHEQKSLENSLPRHSSDLPPQSVLESPPVSSVVRSVSACSDAYTNTVSNSGIFLPTNAQGNMAHDSDNPEMSAYGPCMTCLSEPKNGVFVHSRFLHLCCCYKCAVKIWNKNKKCPICNCAVKNVMKLFIH